MDMHQQTVNETQDAWIAAQQALHHIDNKIADRNIELNELNEKLHMDKMQLMILNSDGIVDERRCHSIHIAITSARKFYKGFTTSMGHAERPNDLDSTDTFSASPPLQTAQHNFTKARQAAWDEFQHQLTENRIPNESDIAIEILDHEENMKYLYEIVSSIENELNQAITERDVQVNAVDKCEIYFKNAMLNYYVHVRSSHNEYDLDYVDMASTSQTQSETTYGNDGADEQANENKNNCSRLCVQIQNEPFENENTVVNGKRPKCEYCGRIYDTRPIPNEYFTKMDFPPVGSWRYPGIVDMTKQEAEDEFQSLVDSTHRSFLRICTFLLMQVNAAKIEGWRGWCDRPQCAKWHTLLDGVSETDMKIVLAMRELIAKKQDKSPPVWNQEAVARSLYLHDFIKDEYVYGDPDPENQTPFRAPSTYVSGLVFPLKGRWHSSDVQEMTKEQSAEKFKSQRRTHYVFMNTCSFPMLQFNVDKLHEWKGWCDKSTCTKSHPLLDGISNNDMMKIIEMKDLASKQNGKGPPV